MYSRQECKRYKEKKLIDRSGGKVDGWLGVDLGCIYRGIQKGKDNKRKYIE